MHDHVGGEVRLQSARLGDGGEQPLLLLLAAALFLALLALGAARHARCVVRAGRRAQGGPACREARRPAARVEQAGRKHAEASGHAQYER